MNKNEKKVINIINSWPNITKIHKTNDNLDNNGIDLIYEYNGKKTYAQIKSYSWNNLSSDHKKKYLNKIRNFIDKNQMTNFYFIFYFKQNNNDLRVFLKKISDLEAKYE